MMVADALSLEYKRDYGCAKGQLELSDLVNYPPLESELRSLGLRLEEEFIDIVLRNVGPFGDDAADSPLISTDRVQHLP